MEDLQALGDARREAALDALRATFGGAAARDFQPISGGISGALILGFAVGDRRYVLRVEPERMALGDRERGYACMGAAAEIGAAPRVYYADPARGVAIIDFVQARPLSEHPGGQLGLARGLGALIARVQETPPFPSLGVYPDAVGSMLARLGASPHFRPGELDAHGAGLQRISHAVRWDASALVSSHNDPNPRNLLFDGERLWLIDWELGFRNDAMVDVAILSTDVIEDPAAQAALLETALGVAVDRVALARLHLVRLVTRLFYGCVVLDGLGDAGVRMAARAPLALSPEGFRRAVRLGKLASGEPETAYAFALMSLAAFAREMTRPAFEQALGLVSRG